MLETVSIPFYIEDVHYTVQVEMPSWSSGYVVDIQTSNGTSLPPVDWEAHAFDDFTLELCVLKALKC